MRALIFLFATGLLSAQSGEWLITVTVFGQPNYQRSQLVFEGDKITGQAGSLKLEGTVRDGRVEIEAKLPNGNPGGKLSGTLTNGEMKGTVLRGADPVEFTAHLIKDRRGAPQTHHFTPTVFYNYFNSSAPPA